MPAPIHIEWHNRPGVGEYGAWRIHGGHDGFDSYTLPKATVYGTAAGGVVITIGYEASGWGYFVDVRYPDYTERHCHLNERPDWIKVGAPVSTSTALGRVGRTGNAKNIFWIRAGVELWHVHSEVYLSRFVQFAKRTNPLPIWGASTAGGSGIPIPTIPEKDENSMSLSIIRSLRQGVGEFLIYVSPTRVATSRELSTISAADRDFEFRVAQRMAEGAGLGPDYKIPTYDDTPNGGWYLRNTFAGNVASMPANWPLTPDNPFIALAYYARDGGDWVGPTTAEIRDALAADFAAVNANIDDQPTSFKITPEE